MINTRLLAAVSVVLLSCSDGPLMVRPEVPPGEPPPHLEERFEYYRTGYFLYGQGDCWFVPLDRTPPGFEFRCGELLLGLNESIEAVDLADLLTEIEGHILRDRSDSRTPRLLVEVPHTTEGTALLRALLDARLRYANPNWTGTLVSPR